ncbi:hypothetical protein N1027_17770 [Herbiconiux sp. CPCC 205763]|uniref:SAF domain-containing protein n=1 Tax=Herbiconiux aconitum TaxID=2970913 RepID=A0ABT2GUU9_9MICO|nr:hypothetical protein [Herbiconiux aconitum]MCS5719983.1 hypothetical protein [Herbiconiux aconitum]
MTTTRERLERRWTPGRVVLLVVGIVVAVLVVGAGVALWWLPPVLAETPRERLVTSTPVRVQDASGSAGVEVAPGWVPLGIGPFLSDDAATLLSPDGVYRAELGLAPLPEVSPTSVASALAALLAAHDLDAGAADSSERASNPDRDTGADADSGPAGPTDEAASGIRWSEETLTSGVTVRYADIVRGDTTSTVAIVLPPVGSLADPAAGTTAGTAASASPTLALTLVAAVPTADAAAYRTVTADLVATATFARAATGSPTPPAAGAARAGGAS